MPFLRHLVGGLACLLLAAPMARADAAPDPLRLVPAQADVFVEIKAPRQLITTALSSDLFHAARALPQVRDLCDSTNVHRFLQLVGYFERELGASWPELLDRLAAGGIVVAIKYGPNPAPALLVVQGNDPALTARFYKTALGVLAQELARQESKETIEKGSYRDIETARIGKEFHAARAGGALLVSNKEDALRLALDCHCEGGKKSLADVASVKDAARLLPPQPLARLWLNLEPVKAYPQAKEFFGSPRDNFILTVAAGGMLDVASRSPYLCAGLYQEHDGYLATVRLPAGRDGASADFGLHVPPAGGPGLLPLLGPKGVIYSNSFFLDVSKLWDDRAKLFNADQARAIEEAEKNTGIRLIGLSPGKLLKQAGARHRIVVVDQPRSAYKDAPPGQPIPAFAFITEMRDAEEFSRSVDAALRAAALLASGQYKLKLTEEKHGEYKIVGWRFPVNVSVAADSGNIRFNFSPCFVRVGNQFAACSTLELCHELVDLLDREAKQPTSKGSRGAVLSRTYSGGGAALLRSFQENFVTQAVLDQAVTPQEARDQIKTLLALVQKLGVLDTEVVYEAKQFRYDIRWKMGK
jgi:hypothetical protein